MHRLFANPQFLLIASLTVIGQSADRERGRGVFSVEPLNAMRLVSDRGGVDVERAAVRGNRPPHPRRGVKDHTRGIAALLGSVRLQA